MSVQIFKNLSPALKEIRIHLCPNSASSNGVKRFINSYYTQIKTKNPKLPILIRECEGVKPKIWFRYEFGRETSSSLENLDEKDIVKIVNSGQ